MDLRPLANGVGATAVVAEWARRWRDRLVMAALIWTGDRDQAEDMVQEALARAIVTAQSDPKVLDEIRRPYAWLAGITRNVTRDARRQQARRERILRENGLEVREQLHRLPDPDWDVDWLCECVQDIAERTLTGRQLRMARRMMAGRTDVQIAREEGVARSTVRWHRRKAVRAVREHVGESGEAPNTGCWGNEEKVDGAVGGDQPNGSGDS